jgi:hypothetical protein
MDRFGLRIVVGLLALVLSAPTYAAFAKGNVLAGVGQGKIKEFTPAGVLVATYDSTTGSNETTGMCMDAAGNLYATMFTAHVVSKFDPNGNLLAANFISLPGSPESCQIDKAGDLLIGTGHGTTIFRYNPTTGALLNTYNASADTGWIDISADQCTVLFGDDGPTIGRFNVCTSAALPDFASVTNAVSGLRILPGTGDVLASNRTGVSRFSSSGTLLGNYAAPSGNNLIFAVTLDPDGQTFWTADLSNGNIFRFTIDPINSTPVTQFNSGQFVDTGGILVVGEITVGGPGPGPTPTPVAIVSVPTVSEWALVALAIGLAGLAAWRMRRRAR